MGIAMTIRQEYQLSESTPSSYHPRNPSPKGQQTPCFGRVQLPAAKKDSLAPFKRPQDKRKNHINTFAFLKNLAAGTTSTSSFDEANAPATSHPQTPHLILVSILFCIYTDCHNKQAQEAGVRSQSEQDRFNPRNHQHSRCWLLGWQRCWRSA